MQLGIRSLLGLQAYHPVWQAMQKLTLERGINTLDECWSLQHSPVYTLGQAGKPEHLLAPSADIPIVKIDRGGQVTYHGPGQVVIYLLLDIKRRGLGVRRLVTHMEQSVIKLLAQHGVAAAADPKAPGVYVDGAKVAALGLRIKRGCSFHGLSLNVDMDLSPFADINPCGYKGLRVTQTLDLGIKSKPAQLATQLLAVLADELGYNQTLNLGSELPT